MSTQPDIQPGILKTHCEQDRNAGYAKIDRRELFVHAFTIFTGLETVFPLEAARHRILFEKGGLADKKTGNTVNQAATRREDSATAKKNAGLAAVEFGRRVTMPPNTLSRYLGCMIEL
jgi:hypothetical protein